MICGTSQQMIVFCAVNGNYKITQQVVLATYKFKPVCNGACAYVHYLHALKERTNK